ncbi:MAG: hypothetical protein KKH52_01145 [Nanoarchaeota archaeon]|nr:hypothetical protein [Nanoarchaeota archaeon]
MEGLSKKEIELISSLEFDKKYFFTAKIVDKFAKDKTQRYNIIKHLLKKKRIIKLNRTKYFLIPVKAKTGGWSEHPFIVIDEMMNKKDYVVGGWAAAHYWRLTDQIPFQYDIYTTKRQGQVKLFHVRIVFHRTTKEKVERGVVETVSSHPFRIVSKKEMKKWMKLRA